MRVVTVFFACVAFRNFARVDASCNGHVRRCERNGPAIRNSRTDARNNGHTSRRRRDDAASQNLHPVLRAWANHQHSHSIEIGDTDADRPQNTIFIKRVVNGVPAHWHLLFGDLVADARIATCNGPHGYAIVEFSDNERVYACLKPNMFHRESRDAEDNSGVRVFLATVYRAGRPELQADLAPSASRSMLNSQGLLFHGEDAIRMLNSQAAGRVQYMRFDRDHPINVDGDLYHFPEPE